MRPSIFIFSCLSFILQTPTLTYRIERVPTKSSKQRFDMQNPISVYVVTEQILTDFLYAGNNIYIYIYIQGVPGGMCQTSGECSLC